MNMKQYQPVGRIVIRRIGEDTLLVPVGGTAVGGRVYPVNETAERVWSSLVEGGTVGHAVEALLERYAVTEAQAQADCEACLRAFLDENLIEPVNT